MPFISCGAVHSITTSPSVEVFNSAPPTPSETLLVLDPKHLSFLSTSTACELHLDYLTLQTGLLLFPVKAVIFRRRDRR